MAKKVHELAKEMNLTSKEVLAKAHDLGITVKSHMSVLSDTDIDKIKGDHKDTKETKIVKAEPKKKETAHEEPRVTVKAATRPQSPSRKPPIGKPVVDNAYLENKHKPPMGKPVVNTAELDKRQKPPVGTPLPKAEPKVEETKAPAVEPAPKAPAAEAAPAPKAEAPKA
ncbi:MAG: translation initiation factor IF-2 N-terminal domain-containing protein, partial [Firmicutes bacterium]|nr:translation initiation factor IF-2 N-terminal domain-containing protein [Bacillota bacterium]